MKVLTVVGARPHFVKAFPVSRELRADHEEVLVHTGQHYDVGLSDVFFEELDIPEPDYNLGVGSDRHGRQTAEMVTGIESHVRSEEPDAVLTYGDTNSTLATAIAVSKMDPALVHVEAGLRSFNREMPEETNRILTDHASDACLAPTESAMEILAREDITGRAYLTGDVMYDALLMARDRAGDVSSIREDLGVEAGEYVLATVHRERNVESADRLASIVDALAAAPQQVVFPVHPGTEQALEDHGLYERADEALDLVDPVGYFGFIHLLDGAERVVTDSGGVQKEAFFVDTACVTMREETEWDETVESGWNVLVGADEDAILRELTGDVSPPAEKPAPFGSGDAASRVVEVLERYE